MLKLWKGNAYRKSRFHDEKGNFVPLNRLLINGPRSFGSTFSKKVFGYSSPVPWISYQAVKAVDKILNKTSVVLEYGSGMSTLWLARRCAKITSVEDNRQWHGIIQEKFKSMGIDNFRYEYLAGEEYIGFASTLESEFDFILVDGSFRTECLRAALPLLRPGGHVYLDDTDKDMVESGRGMREAEALLVRTAVEKQGRLTYFTDFVPGNFCVTQGVLARL